MEPTEEKEEQLSFLKTGYQITYCVYRFKRVPEQVYREPYSYFLTQIKPLLGEQVELLEVIMP